MPRKTLQLDEPHHMRGGFNEAGAECPGKPGRAATPPADKYRFNEAGAECPGKHSEGEREERNQCASMRPGLNAPENRSCARSVPVASELLQ